MLKMVVCAWVVLVYLEIQFTKDEYCFSKSNSFASLFVLYVKVKQALSKITCQVHLGFFERVIDRQIPEHIREILFRNNYFQDKIYFYNLRRNDLLPNIFLLNLAVL